MRNLCGTTKHDWQIENKLLVCKRCGLIREKIIICDKCKRVRLNNKWVKQSINNITIQIIHSKCEECMQC